MKKVMKLMAVAIVISSCLIGKTNAQSYTAAYQPLTYEDFARPLLMYKQAYDRAEVEFYNNWNYVWDFIDANLERSLERPINVSSALNRFQRCCDINVRFKGNIMDWGQMFYVAGLLGIMQGSIDRAKKVLEEGYYKYHNNACKELLDAILNN